jgi:hypothetical protein
MSEEIKKPKKTRSYSINDIYAWKFEDAAMPVEWIGHLGDLPTRFTIYVDGEGGDGKSEWAIQLQKMIAQYMGKTRNINVELKKHKQVRDSFIRNKMKEVEPNRNVQYEIITEFDALVTRLKRPNSGQYIIIDSISFFPLTEKQIQQLFQLFPKKSFILLAYRKHFMKNAAIRHLCDIKVNIKQFVARIESSRFGGGAEYYIWPEKYPPPITTIKGKPLSDLPLFEASDVPQVANESLQ